MKAWTERKFHSRNSEHQCQNLLWNLNSIFWSSCCPSWRFLAKYKASQLWLLILSGVWHTWGPCSSVVVLNLSNRHSKATCKLACLYPWPWDLIIAALSYRYSISYLQQTAPDDAKLLPFVSHHPESANICPDVNVCSDVDVCPDSPDANVCPTPINEGPTTSMLTMSSCSTIDFSSVLTSNQQTVFYCIVSEMIFKL